MSGEIRRSELGRRLREEAGAGRPERYGRVVPSGRAAIVARQWNAVPQRLTVPRRRHVRVERTPRAVARATIRPPARAWVKVATVDE